MVEFNKKYMAIVIIILALLLWILIEVSQKPLISFNPEKHVCIEYSGERCSDICPRQCETYPCDYSIKKPNGYYDCSEKVIESCNRNPERIVMHKECVRWVDGKYLYNYTEISTTDIFELRDDLCKAQGFDYYEDRESIDGNYITPMCCVANCGGTSCESFEVSRENKMDRNRLACGGAGKSEI